MKLDSKHWSTTDGHRYTSVPVKIPKRFTQALQGATPTRPALLVYTCGPYTIVRKPYGTKYSYDVLRDRETISIGGFSRLYDAKLYVTQNAAGKAVRNVA